MNKEKEKLLEALLKLLNQFLNRHQKLSTSNNTIDTPENDKEKQIIEFVNSFRILLEQFLKKQEGFKTLKIRFFKNVGRQRVQIEIKVENNGENK